MTEEGRFFDSRNHVDCRISNLEFLKQAYNTAKGQAFDVDSKVLEHNIAVNLFKDFSTGCYQMTIGCNDDIVGTTVDGKKYHIVAILLLYDCDYSIVINDAENILRVYETEGRIDVGKTYACDIKIRKAAQKATKAAKNAVRKAAQADEAKQIATGAAKDVIKKVTEGAANNVMDEYVATPGNAGMPNAVKRESRDNLILSY